RVFYSAYGLADVAHTLTVQVTGQQGPNSSGNAVIVDGFDYRLVSGSFRTSPLTGGSTAVSLVQSAQIEGTGVASLSQSFPSNNTSGNLIIAFVRMSTTDQSVSVSDSAGDPFTDAVSQVQT